MKTKNKADKIRIGLVVPHIFIMRGILERVIFSPGELAIDLAEELRAQGAEVTIYAPGPVNTKVFTVTSDLTYFESELAIRNDSYLDLLKKHPFTFISLSRQVQSEIIAKAYAAANRDELDIVHIYTNEEDTALPFAELCKKPVVFTHHDPFNFLVKYKNVFPKYKHLPWVSFSMSQRSSMPKDTNWTSNIYHGLKADKLTPSKSVSGDYLAYMGRIIEPKGVHIAINAVKQYNKFAKHPLKLKIAGKHYSDHGNDSYWKNKIEPELDEHIEYVGHLRGDAQKQDFLAGAKALIVPSTFSEPFGMVTIEALACDTPVIGLEAGATKEIISHGETGFIVSDYLDETQAATKIAEYIPQLDKIEPGNCRREFEARFTTEIMARKYLDAYKELIAPR